MPKNLATIHAENLKCFSCQVGNVLFFRFFLPFISFFVLFLFISLTFQSPLPAFQIRFLLFSFEHTSINTSVSLIAFIADISRNSTRRFSDMTIYKKIWVKVTLVEKIYSRNNCSISIYVRLFPNDTSRFATISINWVYRSSKELCYRFLSEKHDSWIL